MKPRRVAIIGVWNDTELELQMEKIIAEFPLFYVVCGGNCESNICSTPGYKWAIKFGAPIEMIRLEGASAEEVINKLAKTADYLVAAYDGSSWMRKLIMNMKMQGKRGRIVDVSKNLLC